MTGSSHWTCITERDGWQAKSVAVSTLACTADEWIVTAKVEAFENGGKVFEKTREKRIARDMM